MAGWESNTRKFESAKYKRKIIFFHLLIFSAVWSHILLEKQDISQLLLYENDKVKKNLASSSPYICWVNLSQHVKK